jgi:hypothetical protein
MRTQTHRSILALAHGMFIHIPSSMFEYMPDLVYK